MASLSCPISLRSPLKIYNQYATYPKLDFFDKNFLKGKALIYKGNSKKIIVNNTSPLHNEIRFFFTNKKPFTDIKLAKEILIFLERI